MRVERMRWAQGHARVTRTEDELTGSRPTRSCVSGCPGSAPRLWDGRRTAVDAPVPQLFRPERPPRAACGPPERAKPCRRVCRGARSEGRSAPGRPPSQPHLRRGDIDLAQKSRGLATKDRMLQGRAHHI
jgi:hypothetical protein